VTKEELAAKLGKNMKITTIGIQGVQEETLFRMRTR